MQPSDHRYKTVASPIGYLRLVASRNALCAVLFNDGEHSPDYGGERDDAHPLLNRTQKQLDEYFSGTRKSFDIALAMNGTVFLINAWRELQKIPYGTTISYGEQARRLGDANKARAVGMANNRNPLAIIVPCHRVIGANGKLVGFGGGCAAKAHLLALEKR